ncbi:hypothetical protein JHN63_02040 [Streptomyces sp. MBT65]|uniref:DUF6233 domain-containing protein n=1 Tax=Streptomyces sp. MBT65 TaxID=1488395 RepID=UPI00190B50EB|nr:DUF6233 domain-containing protein [Streptomyces sp. MBT65]MBK3572622.1 hypothetical protein [Streptomyces sp. MBT65]
MSELPPDPPRLRAILTHLEQQLAATDTIATYLRLQRDAVQQALASAERQNTPRPPAATAPSSPRHPPRATRMRLRPGTYMLEPKIHPDHPRPPIIHIGGCNRPERSTSECTVREAELALTPGLVGAEACPRCRPDLSLGLAQ